jgi:hypothetical protein
MTYNVVISESNNSSILNDPVIEYMDNPAIRPIHYSNTYTKNIIVAQAINDDYDLKSSSSYRWTVSDKERVTLNSYSEEVIAHLEKVSTITDVIVEQAIINDDDYDLKSSSSNRWTVSDKKRVILKSYSEEVIAHLEKVSTITDVLAVLKTRTPFQYQYLFKIISEAIDDFRPDEIVPISVSSLKGMLVFLFSLERFAVPSISISDTGIFYIDWKHSFKDSLTVRFKSNLILEYSLFQPSMHTDKLLIRNGRVHVLDFESDIRKLNIKTHK